MNRFLALKQECKRDGKNYIVSLTGGDCTQSLEGLTAGFEQAYIVTFNDRDDELVERQARRIACEDVAGRRDGKRLVVALFAHPASNVLSACMNRPQHPAPREGTPNLR